MSSIHKDAATGQETTGHIWDGVQELNRPLPRWWLYVFYATIVFALGMFVLYPSIPYGRGYFPGILGFSQRDRVATELRNLSAARDVAMNRIAAASFDQIKADPELLAMATTAGRIAFAENCAPCHGAGGGGQPGYPALAAGAWIWGGTLDAIQTTIIHGIRSGATDAREGIMPRFGADGVLTAPQIQQVADYVYATFYGHPKAGQDVSAGQAIFAENCASCHGEQGQGNPELGAPRLASKVHLYGDSRDVIVNQVTRPHLGVMPNWSPRLSPATIKSLAIYVHGLGGGE